MNIREFWEEQKRERKEKKLQRKQLKKQSLTGEQKAYKIFGIIITLVVVIGAFVYSCNSFKDVGGVNLGSFGNFSEELIAELNKPISEELMQSEDFISNLDWERFKSTINKANLNIISNNSIDKDKLNSVKFNKNFQLSDREIGAFVNNYVSGDGFVTRLYELSIYKENNRSMIHSMAQVDLSDFCDEITNNIYLITKSELRIFDGALKAINSSIQVNQLDGNFINELIDSVDVLGLFSIESYINDLINLSVNTLNDKLESNLKIVDNEILFYK